MFTEAALHVEVDQLDVAAGDKITGRVVLTLMEAQDGTIRVRLGWHTSGLGNVYKVDLEPQDLFSGDLKAGTHSFPFEIQAPNGPFSYDGESMGLGWFVRASAEVPSGQESQDSTAFKLSGPATHDTLAYSLHDVPKLFKNSSTAGWIEVGSGAVLLAVGAYIVMGQTILGGLSLLFGANLIAAGFPTILAKTQIKDIQLTLDPVEVRAGSNLRLRVSYATKPNVVVKQAKLVVTCHEEVTSGSGKARSCSKPIVFEWERPVPKNRNSFEGSFEVPHIYSLNLGDNRVIWTVALKIEIANWPDFEVKSEFLVLPPIKQHTNPTTDGIW